MKRRGYSLYLLMNLTSLLLLLCAANAQPGPVQPIETRYLAFQCFTGAPDPAIPISGTDMHPLGPMPSKADLSRFMQDIVHRIGTTGKKQTRLAVIFGPLTFDHTDAQITQFIETAFTLALEQKIAVGFHLDDSMYWAARKDLWQNPANIEWLDWDGTPATGRRIDWGPRPDKLPPQMCFNSPAIQAEVQRRAQRVIGMAIKAGLDRLRRQGQSDLFAGVIMGWETQLGQDFETGRYTGYHAMVNRGYRKDHLPNSLDAEREQIVQEFITLWCKGLADAGIPLNNIYSHTAFLSQALYKRSADTHGSYSERNHFAPPPVAFGPYRRPGFSTYPQTGHFEQIYMESARHKAIGWASSEGTNWQPGNGPNSSGMSMETYLAKMFNHGAALVNLFAWGIGGEANKDLSPRVATEREEALNAYRKFLRGERLVESRSLVPSDQERLQAKIHRIQQELPAWVQKTGNQAQVEPMMRELDSALKANDFPKAEMIADRILTKLSEK